MARRPAKLERSGPLTPRDQMWRLIRALGRPQADDRPSFSPSDIIVLTGLHVDTVCTYFRGLAKAQPPFLTLVSRDRPAGSPRRECFRYTLSRDVGVEAPAVTAHGRPTNAGRGMQQMWMALRALREFNCVELASAATTSSHRVRLESAKAYVRYLTRAGYLGISAPSRPGTPARYRFLAARNTGPRAPLLCRDKSVIDANTGAVVYQKNGPKL